MASSKKLLNNIKLIFELIKLKKEFFFFKRCVEKKMAIRSVQPAFNGKFKFFSEEGVTGSSPYMAEPISKV